jgi:hypothetical protein
MDPMNKALLVILLRQIAPLLGGAGLFSDNDLGEIAGGLILLGSVAYHAYQRVQGRKETFKVSDLPTMSLLTLSGPGPIAESAQRHAEAIAKVQTEKPAAFTVGAYTDGREVRGEVTVDRKWNNGFGLTAYLRGWYNAAPVTPLAPKKFGGEAGVEGRYEFPQK